ncbi:hypothetical protein EJ08DRAFT_644940 [Tothia fuscella]|uniref:Uncharacterized protein n=1 Tax=Tothia fuscella TaxID=1048955 RepID=A0A9P4U4F5_9PEZI|nr:hypothetical protein EJ08DRAFT_644940 [Tothia fuscella]
MPPFHLSNCNGERCVQESYTASLPLGYNVLVVVLIAPVIEVFWDELVKMIYLDSIIVGTAFVQDGVGIFGPFTEVNPFSAVQEPLRDLFARPAYKERSCRRE